jgi:hypothetical protein
VPGILRMRDIAFEVDHARSQFFAYVPQESPGQASSGRLHWSLEVYCLERQDGLEFAAPSLQADQMTFDVRDWKLLEGRTVRNAGTEGLVANLYVHEGRRTSDNSIRFVSRGANVFTIEWECLADPCWDEDYSTRLPLQLNAEIVFNGIHIWWLKADAKGVDEARELIGRHFDLTCLEGPRTDSPYHIVFPPKLLK